MRRIRHSSFGYRPLPATRCGALDDGRSSAPHTSVGSFTSGFRPSVVWTLFDGGRLCTGGWSSFQCVVVSISVMVVGPERLGSVRQLPCLSELRVPGLLALRCHSCLLPLLCNGTSPILPVSRKTCAGLPSGQAVVVGSLGFTVWHRATLFACACRWTDYGGLTVALVGMTVVFLTGLFTNNCQRRRPFSFGW